MGQGFPGFFIGPGAWWDGGSVCWGISERPAQILDPKANTHTIHIWWWAVWAWVCKGFPG